jgi:hypothetical protein
MYLYTENQKKKKIKIRPKKGEKPYPSKNKINK